MKKSVLNNLTGLGLVVALAATASSCEKFKKAVPDPKFDWDGASTSLTLPATSDTSAQKELGITEFSYNLDSMFKAETKKRVGIELGYDRLKSVKIKTIRLTLENGDASNNFANFVYAGANLRTNHNNDVYTLGYVPSNPDTYSVDLTIPAGDPNKDIKSYFKGNTTFSYAAIAKLRRPTTKDLKANMKVTYEFELATK
jgi:hypothetical protein